MGSSCIVNVTGVTSPPLVVDFGTSHTVSGIHQTGFTPLLIDGSPLLPSAVFAEADGTLTVGRDAVNSVRIDPARFEPTPKRRIDDRTVLLGDREFSVTDLIAAVLRRVTDEYRRVVGTPPTSVTLTHPAAWGPTRRLVLVDAATTAGINTPTLVAEPIAAAAHFAHNHDVATGSAVVVADFGGGTFDCSLVRRTATGFDVITADGHDHLGGIDVDEAVVTHIRSQFDGDGWSRLVTPTTPSDRRHRRSLYDDVRSAKERLSRRESADLYLPVLDRDVHLTRRELEQLATPLVERATAITQAVLRLSDVDPSTIIGLFLVGGGSRMPLAATMLHRATGLAPTVVDQPETAVAQGALSAASRLRETPSPRRTAQPMPHEPVGRSGAPPGASSVEIMRAASAPAPAVTAPTPDTIAPQPQTDAAHTGSLSPAPKRLWLVAILILLNTLLTTVYNNHYYGSVYLDVFFGFVLLTSAALLLVRRTVALWGCVIINILVGVWPWV